MKQFFFRAMLTALPLFAFLHVLAQDKTDRFSVHPKNTFLVGINMAVNGSYDEISYYYRNEYLRSFSRIFEGGVSLGFFNYHGSQITITY